MLGFGGLLVSALLVGAGWFVDGSDVNWGKKVNCFVVDETVVCPGCNYRAGLSCPRSLKNSRNCLESSTQPSTGRYPPKGKPTTFKETNLTVPTTPEISTTSLPDSSEVDETIKKDSISMAIYLYRLLGSKLPNNRNKREVKTTVQSLDGHELGEVCNWNGDCPCPQICCKTGPGCPKRCVMGIRLPPPWG